MSRVSGVAPPPGQRVTGVVIRMVDGTLAAFTEAGEMLSQQVKVEVKAEVGCVQRATIVLNIGNIESGWPK